MLDLCEEPSEVKVKFQFERNENELVETSFVMHNDTDTECHEHVANMPNLKFGAIREFLDTDDDHSEVTMQVLRCEGDYASQVDYEERVMSDVTLALDPNEDKKTIKFFDGRNEISVRIERN